MTFTLKIIILTLFFLTLITSSSAFEDTFQYYPSDDFSETWNTSGNGETSISQSGGTFNRAIRLFSDVYSTGSETLTLQLDDASSGKYWSFNVLAGGIVRTGGTVEGSTGVRFYNASGVLIAEHQLFYGQVTGSMENGLYEYYSDDGTNLTLRINGIEQGTVDTLWNDEDMAIIEFYVTNHMISSSGTYLYAHLTIDDISNDGNIIDLATESKTHTFTDSNSASIDVSWTTDSYPLSTFNSSLYEIVIKSYINGNFSEISRTTVKPATNTSPFAGIQSYNEDTLTNNSSSLGTYYFYLERDGTSIASDYFTLISTSITSGTTIDSFQYYPNGDFTSNWVSSGNGASSIITQGGTNYNRALYLYSNVYFWGSETVTYNATNVTSSNYWSFRVLGGSMGGVGSHENWVYVVFLDEDSNVLLTDTVLYSTGSASLTTGLYEYLVSDSNDVTLRINGQNQGVQGTVTENPSRIRFYVRNHMIQAGGTASSSMIVDDVSTNGNVVSIASENTSRILNSTHSNTTEITWSMNSYPLDSFNDSTYKIVVNRSLQGINTTVNTTTIKQTGDTSTFSGLTLFNRSRDFTSNDTINATYYTYLAKDDIKITNDYFLFGDIPYVIFQSLSISPTTFPQSQSTTITAWITGVSVPTSVIASIFDPFSNTINISLPSIGSDIYSAQFTQTNTPGRHYVTTVYADSSNQNYNLLYPFTVTATNTENTGGSSSSSSSTPISTSTPTSIPTTNPLDNILPNLPDSLTQNNPIIESITQSLTDLISPLQKPIKQTISYIITPSLYLFDITFLLLLILLMFIVFNQTLVPSKIIFFSLTVFILLRLLNLNLTTLLTGLT